MAGKLQGSLEPISGNVVKFIFIFSFINWSQYSIKSKVGWGLINLHALMCWGDKNLRLFQRQKGLMGVTLFFLIFQLI